MQKNFHFLKQMQLSTPPCSKQLRSNSAFAQNWCSNTRFEHLHSSNQFPMLRNGIQRLRHPALSDKVASSHQLLQCTQTPCHFLVWMGTPGTCIRSMIWSDLSRFEFAWFMVDWFLSQSYNNRSQILKPVPDDN